MSIPTATPRSASDSSPDHGEHLVRPPVRSVSDPFCILVWKFAIAAEHVDRFVALCDTMAQRVVEQPKTLFQRLTRAAGTEYHVRVGLEDSYGVLAHVIMFSDTLKQIGALGSYRGMEVHGPGPELAGLRRPLAPWAPLFFQRDNEAPI